MNVANDIKTNRQAAQALKSATRLVVKVGSAILCGADGEVNTSWLESLAADIAVCRVEARDVVVVTSGAIALGRAKLDLGGKLRLDEKQAASAAGQIALAECWQAAFAKHDIKVAQVLLTLEDNETRRRYLNARAAINTLLELGAVPLVNENDTVATSEIRYGDNDRLGAHTAQLVSADVLVILSDVDGLYTADPQSDSDARHIDVVDSVTPEIEAMAAGPNRIAGIGSGGMMTKLAAAKIAGAGGCSTVIAPGSIDHPLRAIADGGRATLIRAAATGDTARRKWIAGRLDPAGSITIDAGAVKALAEGASLLPAGVAEIEGAFARGDTVALIGPDGTKLGQGLVTFDANDLNAVKGKHSKDIERVLGYRRRPVVIERSDLALARKTGDV